MNKNLELKSIGEILDKNFFIPSFQRGYRWDKKQVEDLLDDITEFVNSKREETSFYCLQPIVVIPEEIENKIRYRIIDGQQRLTTIFLILKLFNEIEFKNPKNIYNLSYETRAKSKEYLDNIKTSKSLAAPAPTTPVAAVWYELKINPKLKPKEIFGILTKRGVVLSIITCQVQTWRFNKQKKEELLAKQLKKEEKKEVQEYANSTENESEDSENIDFYYFKSNFQYIDEWFKKKLDDDGTFIQKLYPILMENVKIIWYKIDNKQNEIDIFTRLNIGKIPLTNAELIKALFVISTQKENEKILLASQWDEIEYKLQDNQFFSFINRENFIKPTRIEYVFDLIADNKDITIDNLPKDDDKKSYYVFSKLLNEDGAKERWDEVKKYFRIFNELHDDNEYYHLVGYLVHNSIKVKDIIFDFTNNTKDDFSKYLTEEIQKLIETNDLSSLNYDDDKDTITKILFLFNVISTMNSGYSKYPFNLHNSQKWSLEHIHAQTSDKVKKEADRLTILKSQIDYIDDKDLKAKANNLISNKNIIKENFDEIQSEIFSKHSDNINDIHAIGNLALLSRNDNSWLNNNIFPVKRDKIIKEKDRKGVFIPIATKNVFLKYYSKTPQELLIWNIQDRKDYIEAMEETLKKYINFEEVQ